VLVFTRTKFGANNVAEFLTKNGINAMALHGNKSQSARTQALGGFKSGDIRALVATDIAARGIDIDELPHVVNYEIPNVPEDYVHRIGRTGRAGNEGQAVSFVCLDEEGFMQEIERFTKQTIPVVPVEGFGVEPGERAEPIAMGRQTLWGGAGKPPSREVMAAAAKAARQEMVQRIRVNKAADAERGGGRSGGGRKAAGDANGAEGTRESNGNGQGARNGSGNGNGSRGNGSRENGNGSRRGGQRSQQQPQHHHAGPRHAHPQPPHHGQPHHERSEVVARHQDDDDRNEDRIPRNIDPLRTNMPGRRDMTGVQRVNANGQPDPTRTSIDSMGATKRRGGGGGGGGRRGGGGGGGGGGGYGSRGNNNSRSFGR
jgi:ATP-dependent RNA helicase RhlE